jgi:acetyl esterase/lipase
MADFNALEALINAHIKKNGVQAITGNILNGILRGMVSALGKGYTIAGVAVPSSDPGTMTGPLAYLAYTAGTYTHFGGLEVGQGEVSMLIYNEAEWHKEVLFILSATATVDDNVGTPEVGVSFVDGLLTFDFRNMKGNPGNDGDAAGFGTINATVDGNVGTPGVSVQSSGPDTAKNITFQFTNLKGETGVTSVVATVDNTVGTPTCTVSLVGQQLTLAFSGLKGAQGDTGSSVDYPFTIVNNLTTNDATQALSAAMGVQLESEISQLEAELDGNFTPGYYLKSTGEAVADANWGYSDYTPYSGGSVNYKWNDTYADATYRCLVFYNANKEVIDYFVCKNATSQDDGRILQSTDIMAGTAFLRLSFYLGSNSHLIINGVTAWTPDAGIKSEISTLEFDTSALNTKVNKSVSVVTVGNISRVSDNQIKLTSVVLFHKDNTYETVYANGGHTEETFTFGSGAVILVAASGTMATRANSASLQSSDIILLQWSSTYGFTAGLLMPHINKIDITTLQGEINTNTGNTILPGVEMGRLTNDGDMTEMIKSLGGSTNVVYLDKTYWRTGNYIRIDNSKSPITLKASIGVYCMIFYYDKDFSWVGSGNPATTSVSGLNYFKLTANTDYTITATNVPSSAKYMKFCFRSAAGASGLQAINRFDFSVSGNIPADWNTKNIKTPDVADYGAYQTVAALVNVTNPNSTDAITDVVQDSVTLKYDYGVLALPLQYTNIGKPTRLIIYCHGAGANYTLQSNRFLNSIDARLWLSEGYAVLDMDADPYTDNNSHGFIPGARQCIESAYKWIVEHYNIYDDGILLAGKSMGGGMTFDILSSSVIPVIASCAIVPVCNYIWWWEYMNATRRAFCAEKLGFVGTAPTWTSSSPMSQAEWDYLKDNYDKFILYNPFTRLMANPPSKDELFANMNLSASTTTPTQAEIDLWKDRVVKVPCPVKIFIGQDDTTVPPLRNGKFMFDMLKRGSEIVEYRQFTTGGHGIENPNTTGHLQDIVNSYGITIEDAPVVFAEILNFWQRYEN